MAPVFDPTFRGGNGNVGIIRSPVRAIALPDCRRLVQYPGGFTVSRGEMKISVKSFRLGVAICGEAPSEQLSLAC